MDDLRQEVRATANNCKRRGYLNHWTCLFLMWLAVLSSIAAAIAVTMPFNSAEFQSILTAAPAAAVFINNTFRFEMRAIWHWEKSRRLYALERSLRFEGLSADAASRQLSTIIEEMENRWPTFAITSDRSMQGAVMPSDKHTHRQWPLKTNT